MQLRLARTYACDIAHRPLVKPLIGIEVELSWANMDVPDRCRVLLIKLLLVNKTRHLPVD